MSITVRLELQQEVSFFSLPQIPVVLRGSFFFFQHFWLQSLAFLIAEVYFTRSVMVFILSLNTIGIYSPTSYSCSGRQRLLKKHLHFEYSDIFSVTKCVRKCKPLFTLCSVSTLRRLCPGLVLQKKTLIFFSPSNNGMISFVILNKSDCSSFCQPALWSFITIWMVVFKFEWLAGFQDE